jgi:hypothetical protein
LTSWGGAGFCWLAIGARITGGTSWPPQDLVFTIWSLEKYISEWCIELMHNKINSKRYNTDFQLGQILLTSMNQV